MSANTNPIYGRTPFLGYCQISAANTNRDGSGTLGTVATGGPDGTRINIVKVVGVGTVSNGIVRLFISNDVGATKRLLTEIQVTATTPSGTAIGFATDYIFNSSEPLYLPDANSILYASTHNADTFNIVASGLKY